MSPINDAVRINKAPMQGLRERIAAQQGEIAALKAEVAELRAIVQPPSRALESATFTILLTRLREYGAWVSGDWRKRSGLAAWPASRQRSQLALGQISLVSSDVAVMLPSGSWRPHC